MIECYYSMCKNHCKDEPFCGLNNCVATEVELEQFAIQRRKDLIKMETLRINHDKPNNEK